MGKSLRGVWGIFLIIAFVVTMSSCGGGSTGTGGQQFKGTIVSRTGEPLANVHVTITDTGDDAVTDSNGFYLIDTDVVQNTVTYLFEGPGFQITFRLENLPAEKVAVIADFSVDDSMDTAEPLNVQIEDKGDNGHGNSSSSTLSSNSSHGSSSSGASNSSSSSGGDDEENHGSNSSVSSDSSSSHEDESSSEASSSSEEEDMGSSSMSSSAGSSDNSSSSSEDHGGGSSSGGSSSSSEDHGGGSSGSGGSGSGGSGGGGGDDH